MPHAESGQITKRPAIFAALALKPAYALRGVGGIHHEPEQQAFPGGHAPLQPPASGQEEPRAHFEDSRVAGRTLIRVRRPIVYYLRLATIVSPVMSAAVTMIASVPDGVPSDATSNDTAPIPPPDPPSLTLALTL